MTNLAIWGITRYGLVTTFFGSAMLGSALSTEITLTCAAGAICIDNTHHIPSEPGEIIVHGICTGLEGQENSEFHVSPSGAYCKGVYCDGPTNAGGYIDYQCFNKCQVGNVPIGTRLNCPSANEGARGGEEHRGSENDREREGERR